MLGNAKKYAKYSRYFRELTPVLEVPGAIIAGALSSYGVAFGSLTWNLRDVSVKGHLPRSETDRVASIFRAAPDGGSWSSLTMSCRAARPGGWVWPTGARPTGGSWPWAPMSCCADTITRRAPGRSTAPSR